MVKVQLSCGSEDRMTEELGPFEFVEITYGDLWIGPDRKQQLAYIDEEGGWIHNGEWYSDISIWAA